MEAEQAGIKNIGGEEDSICLGNEDGGKGLKRIGLEDEGD